MSQSSKILTASLVLVVASVFLGDNPVQQVTILWPPVPDSVSYDQAKLLIVSAKKDSAPGFLLSTQWSVLRYMDVVPKTAKDDFPKDFYKLFGPKTTLERLIYTFQVFNGYEKPETLSFAYTDTISIRSLWKMPAMKKLAQGAQASEVLGVIVSMTGWKDSIYTPVYDDPNAEGRALYKLHVQLIPGTNTVYLGFADQKKDAIVYATSYTNGYQANEDRPVHFHNSTLEQSCVVCHEGLPSSDSGRSMKADCNVCHKTFTGASYLHSPVEMKSCGSCHSWSAEKKVLVLEQGVPATCYTCHEAKKKQVENSSVPHPVAGECLTCHSPHGSEKEHILKLDVYTLCTGCHEDQKLNHPVGRHPLRFKQVTQTGEEISCVSCHNPHGTENPHLLKVGPGSMEVCSQCH